MLLAAAGAHEKQPNLLHPARALWACKDSGSGATMLPPLPESQISSVRQKARLDSLHLEHEGEWEVEQQELQQEGKGRLQVPTELQVCGGPLTQHLIILLLQGAGFGVVGSFGCLVL